MNYQDYIKYDPEKKQYTDSYGYVIDGVSSKVIPTELTTAGEAIAIANTASATAASALAAATSGNFQTVTAGYGLTNQLAITTISGTATLTPTGTDTSISVTINPKGGDGCLKVGANYAKHVALLANNTAKVSTRYSGSTSADLSLECKGATGKIVFTNETSGGQYESLEMVQANGSTTCTAGTTQSGVYPNSDIKFVPRGLGIVTCSSWTYDAISSTASPQTLTTNASTKVTINTLIYDDFPAGFMTNTADTFQNTSGRTITLMVSACIRENPASLVSGRNLGLYITRTNNSTYQYGQVLLNSTTDTTDPTGARALSTSSIIRLANNESFSVWASTNAAGVVIGGSNSWNLSIITFRLMP